MTNPSSSYGSCDLSLTTNEIRRAPLPIFDITIEASLGKVQTLHRESVGLQVGSHVSRKSLAEGDIAEAGLAPAAALCYLLLVD